MSTLPTTIKHDVDKLNKLVELVKWHDDMPGWIEVSDRFHEQMSDLRDENSPDLEQFFDVPNVTYVCVEVNGNKPYVVLSFADESKHLIEIMPKV